MPALLASSVICQPVEWKKAAEKKNTINYMFTTIL